VIIEEGTPIVSRGPVRPRWMVAVVAAVAALAVAIGGVAGAFLVNGRVAGSGMGSAASYVPADAFMYMEGRLDLPGDQRALLGEFLSHFPDEASHWLSEDLPKMLDDELAKKSAGFTYSGDIAPWFDGRLAVAMPDYPSNEAMLGGTPPSLLGFIGSRDRQAASAFIAEMRAKAEADGATFTSSQHRGIEIVTGADARAGESAGSESFAYAVTEDQVVFSTSASQIEAALDVHAGSAPALAGSDEVRRAETALPAERVATVVTNYAPVLDQMKSQLGAMGIGPEVLDAFSSFTPGILVGAGRIEGDRLRFDAASSIADGGTPVANRERTLARSIPADAIYVSEGNDVGAALAKVISALKDAVAKVPEADMQQLNQIESVLGSDLESFVSWMGDTAMVAGYRDGEVYAGLVASTKDADAAERRLRQLTSLAKLSMISGGPPLEVVDETVAGVDVTTIQYGTWSGDPQLGGLGRLTVQYAIDDDMVVIGFGDKFVSRVLQLGEADSLAASDRYQKAIASVGGPSNAGSVFVDLAALRQALEPVLRPMLPGSGPTYEKEIRPWLDPFGYIVGVNQADGDRLVQHSAIVVK
jgi:hypothetical protein